MILHPVVEKEEAILNLNVMHIKLRLAVLLLTTVAFFLFGLSAYSQTDITTITTSTEAGTTSTSSVVIPDDAGNSLLDDRGEDVTINYGQGGAGSNVKVDSYVAGGVTYDRFLRPDTLILNRTSPTDRLVNIWYTLNSAIVDNDPPTANVINTQSDEASDADAIYLTGNLNAGYDNILVNVDPAGGGIIEVETERVDVIWYNGMRTSEPDNAVFPIVERGGNDNIAVAAILSLNSDGTPATYSNLIGIGENGWPGVGVSFDNYIVLRRETAGVDPIPILPIGVLEGQSAQTIQGVAISFTDFGIAANTPVFGYSIFPADIVDGYTTNSGQILTTGSVSVAAGVDLADISTFPTNTNSNDSGLDYIAGISAAVASDDNLIEIVGPGGFKDALATWLKANEADDITTSTDGSTVSDWQDHWTGDNDATTGATSNPTYRSTSSAINFNPTVDFTSSTTSLSIANNTDFNTATSYTNKGLNLAFRTSTTDVTTRQVLYEQGGADRGIIVYILSGNLHVSAYNRASDGTGAPWNNSGNINTVSTAVSIDTEYIVTLELAGSSAVSGTLTGYLNGASFGILSNVGLLFNDTDGIEFGGSDGTSQYGDGSNASTNSFQGEISEFIYCNEPGSFTTTQRDRIESYLAIKYGITLDQTVANNYVNSDGDVIFNTTLNASIGGYLEYNNDIAGIGRDDAAELDQPASRSENAGSVVTIDRGATISTDDTWLIWGNDGAALTETALLTMPDTIDQRLNRVWRVAEENQVFSTSVSFDLAGLGLSTNPNDFSLLIAANNSNADFSNATVVSGATIDGDVITFTGVNLEDGQYFTLGTDFFQCSPGGVEDSLTLWLRADDGPDVTTDATNINSWADKSGEGHDATSVSGSEPNFAATSINFNPTINFDGTSEEMVGTAGFNSVAYYLVVNPDDNLTSASTAQVPLGFGAGAGATNDVGSFVFGSITGAFAGEVITHLQGGTGTTYRTGVSSTNQAQINSGQSYLLAVRDDADAATTSEIFVDGLEQADLSAGSILTSLDEDYNIANFTQATTDAFSLNGFFDGQIGEIISYSTRPDNTEHQRIQSYLAVKYGITLDQGTPTNYLAADAGTVWNATDNSGFANDIAGIGRDDLSCLDQRQSRSQNSSSIVTMGLGEIAENNAANANAFTNDDAFLIWGNDGASALEANAVAYTEGVVTERMLRIWKVDENAASVGATDISFDLSGLGYTGSLSDYNLIISDASGLTSPTIIPASSFTSDVVTFNNVDLTDGQFFTLGTARTACGPAGVTSNLSLWLRADAGTNSTTNGAEITSWTDQGGVSTISATGGTAPTYVSNDLNFNPGLDFDGTEFMEGTAGLNSTAYYMVISPDEDINNATGLEFPLSFDVSSATSTLTSDIGGFALGNLIGGGTELITHFVGLTSDYMRAESSARTITANTPLLYTIRDDADVATQTTISENGFRIDNSDLGGGSIISFSDEEFELGRLEQPNGVSATSFFYNGQTAEVISFSSRPSDIQNQQIQSYLSIKYGITLTNDNNANSTTGETIDTFTEGDYLTSDGSVIWDFSENTTYHNDVAGIGRDDDGCFVQKQSSSVNSDAILTIGLGSVATTNALNGNAFDDNGDYLIWGNDDGATAQASANIVDIPATIAERMTRIWRVEDTGNVGATELQFDLTDLGYSVADAEAFSLLVGNTATMADATIITGGTLDGNILSFTGIDLTDGQFFTIGTSFVTCGPGGVNTNIALWLRADEEAFSDGGSTLAADGNNVLQWNDQSSPADNGAESNLFGAGPIEPTFQTSEINFNPVLRFVDPNSTNASYIETGTNTVSGDMTLISVFKTGQADGTSNDFVNSPALIGASETTGTADYGLGMENGTLWVNANNAANSFDVETTGTFNDNNPHFVTATRVESSGAISIFVDGNSEATGTGSTGALGDPTSFGIGNHSDGDVDAQFAGDIAETLVFSSVLTSDERNRVESYLSLKYGLTMNPTDDGATGGVDERDYRAADGGVIWDFSDKSTYTNDIFGIGRDDLSCFEQQQSKSENSDGIVTFNNNGAFGTDDSFLISGNDDAALEAIENKERPDGINSRLNREWQVQETGTVGSIQLTYDLSDISGPAGVGTNNANLLRLMVDDDGDFGNGGTTLITPTSIDGANNTVTFDVDFTDGQFYTLGSAEEDALPITLISFNATARGQQVILNWATASENNNAFFEVERSIDGINFEAIGTLEGAGDSDQVIEYQFIDINPIQGQAFYRLKQTDFNGDFEYSELQRVFIQVSEAHGAYLVYPNPVNTGEKLYVKPAGQFSGTMSYQLMRLNGQLVRAGKVNNESEAPFLSTAGLNPGMYMLKLMTETQAPQTVKFIVR